jgi:hypothetical protein
LDLPAPEFPLGDSSTFVSWMTDKPEGRLEMFAPPADRNTGAAAAGLRLAGGKDVVADYEKSFPKIYDR